MRLSGSRPRRRYLFFFSMRRSAAFDYVTNSCLRLDPDPSSWLAWPSTARSVSSGATASSPHLTPFQAVKLLAHGLGTPSLTEPDSQVASALSLNSTTHGVASSSLTTVRYAVTPITTPELVNLAEEHVSSTTSTSQRLGLAVASNSAVQSHVTPAITRPVLPSIIPPFKSRRKVGAVRARVTKRSTTSF